MGTTSGLRALGRWVWLGLPVLCLLGWARAGLSQPAPPAATLSGVVTSAKTKQPLPGAMLLIFRASASGEADVWQQQTTADAAGAYRFSVLSAGTYHIAVVASGHVPQASAVTVAETGPVTLDFRLLPLREIIGRALGPDGAPLQSEHVYCCVTPSRALSLAAISILTRGAVRAGRYVDTPTGENGAFQVREVVPEPLTMFVMTSDAGAYVDVVFPEEGNADVGAVQLKAWVTVRGTVVNAETKQPVPSANVSLTPLGLRGAVGASGEQTNQSGQFSLRRVVPHGSYRLQAYVQSRDAPMLRGTVDPFDLSAPGKEYQVTIEVRPVRER